jgi:hypothetical protein
VQDDVDVARQRSYAQAHRFAHAPFDAIAFHRFAKDAPGSQTHARTRNRASAAFGEEVCHRRREVFAAPLINALIICVLA